MTDIPAKALRDLDLLASDADAVKELSDAATKPTDEGELNDFIQKLQVHLLGNNAKAFADQLDQPERESTAIDGATGAAAERLKVAQKKFTIASNSSATWSNALTRPTTRCATQSRKQTTRCIT